MINQFIKFRFIIQREYLCNNLCNLWQLKSDHIKPTFELSLDMAPSQEHLKITPTKDGSTTLYSPQFKQHYHNPNGAVAESRHVFFETPGVPDAILRNETTVIFETGFGTGLNLLLLLEYLNQSSQKSKAVYYSVEAFPVDATTAMHFDFGDNPFLNHNKMLLVDIFGSLKPGLNAIEISGQITLHLFIGYFDQFFKQVFINKRVDCIFHDAFSPEVNADLWTADVFRNLANVCKNDAVLSTYCAATSARAAMAASGWFVARAKGALGKREMTIASLNPEKLAAFKRVDESRLAERYINREF